MTEQATTSSASNSTESALHAEIGRSRSVLLSYLLKLNKSVDANHNDLVQAIAQRFNETLVDYISYGHFRLLEACAPETHELVAIERSTQRALQFNDTYNTRDGINLAQLKQDLEALVYALEVRFEIEDDMLLAEA